MHKVKANVVLKNLGIVEEKTSYDVEARYDKEKGLAFVEVDEHNETTHHFYIDGNNLVMERENHEMKMSLIFDEDVETSSKYFYKDLDFAIDLSVMTEEINVNMPGGYIYVKYYLDMSNQNQGCFELEINFD